MSEDPQHSADVVKKCFNTVYKHTNEHRLVEL